MSVLTNPHQNKTELLTLSGTRGLTGVTVFSASTSGTVGICDPLVQTRQL